MSSFYATVDANRDADRLRTPAQAAPVVGIWGGANALKTLAPECRKVPPDTSRVFFRFKHMPLDHRSGVPGHRLTKIKAHVTRLEKTLRIKADHVCTLSPGRPIHLPGQLLRGVDQSGMTTNPCCFGRFFSSLAAAPGLRFVGLPISRLSNHLRRALRGFNRAPGSVICRAPQSLRRQRADAALAVRVASAAPTARFAPTGRRNYFTSILGHFGSTVFGETNREKGFSRGPNAVKGSYLPLRFSKFEIAAATPASVRTSNGQVRLGLSGSAGGAISIPETSLSFDTSAMTPLPIRVDLCIVPLSSAARKRPSDQGPLSGLAANQKVSARQQRLFRRCHR
jgi:hypothetical protein